MAFGQQSGPPATQRQLRELLTLLENLGYTSFRDARGPMGFNQRQGGGKFTAGEAADLIEQLEREAHEAATGTGADAPSFEEEAAAVVLPRTVRKGAPVTPPSAATAASAAERRVARQSAALRDIPAKLLAKELERRRWIVIPPEELTTPEPDPTA